MHFKAYSIRIVAALVVTLAAGCAKQGMPSGGPKDVTPPALRRSQPDNRTLHFGEKSFYVEFDEYVVLKDAENNILVSPPMRTKPEYKTKGRGIQVNIKDTLMPNTTYLFQFKEAVADFNEGNVLPSLEYVFSTGSYIDSMTLGGSVLDALTQTAREETVSVWLFDEVSHGQLLQSLTDTAVEKPVPTYITRCDKSGRFGFNNIRPGRYHAVAVVDEDKNMQIGPAEAVAFLDDVVEAVAATDSSIRDSSATDSTLRLAADRQVRLSLFNPKKEVQRITGSGFKAEGRAQVTTLLPMQAPQLDAGGEALTWRLNATRDTLTLWTLREKCDSLHLVISDPSGVQDTLKMRWRARRGQGTMPPLPADSRHTEMKLGGNQLPFFDTLTLRFTLPLDTSRCQTDSSVVILNLKDSSMARCSVVADSTLMRLRVLFPFRQGEKYDVSIAKGCYHDIYGYGNDSLHAVVSVTRAEEYGNLFLRLEADSGGADCPLVVQLMSEKGTVVAGRRARTGDRVEFMHITPGKYRVRVIIDCNGNGQWDPGDFADRMQPERVLFFKKQLDIRANWDFDEIMTLSTP